MLATMLTAMYLVVRIAEKCGLRFAQQDILPYVVAQPMPWQVHYVSQSRCSSRTDECDGLRHSNENGLKHDNGQCPPNGLSCKDKAAATIQAQYRKYQQKKNGQTK